MNAPTSTLPQAYVVLGPTASGKTQRAVALAQAVGGEIVSADSRQVYRGMDIGSGKDLEDYGPVAYHMIDVAEPGSKFTLFDWLRGAREAVADIARRGRVPIVCGGTGLYLETLVKGTQLPPVPENPELRAELEGKSLAELTEILRSMKRLHNSTDTDSARRAIRAIEIECWYADHPDLAPVEGNEMPVADFRLFGVDVDRNTRRQRISERLRARVLGQDMLGEINRLIDCEGVDPEALIGYGLEYRFLTLWKLGRMEREEMLRQLEIAIHQFAKRQMTWFRGMERRLPGHPIQWIDGQLSPAEFAAAVLATR